MNKRLFALLLAACLVLSACGGGAAPAPSSQGGPVSPAVPEPPSEEPSQAPEGPSQPVSDEPPASGDTGVPEEPEEDYLGDWDVADGENWVRITKVDCPSPLTAEYHSTYPLAMLSVLLPDGKHEGVPCWSDLSVLDPGQSGVTTAFLEGPQDGTRTFSFTWAPRKEEGREFSVQVMLQELREEDWEEGKWVNAVSNRVVAAEG